MMKTDHIRDEREHKLFIGSLAAAGGIAYFYALILLIFKLIKTRDFSNVYVEFGLLMIMVIAMYIHRIVNRSYNIPSTIGGKQLPTGDSQEDKRTRIFYYIRDSLSFALLMTLINYKWKGPEGLLFKTKNSYLGLILDGTLTFVTWIFINYFRYERNVKKYNDYCQSLEDEIAQTKCPNCGKEHDLDYPKCPYCRYDYCSNKE